MTDIEYAEYLIKEFTPLAYRIKNNSIKEMLILFVTNMIFHYLIA